MFVGLPVYWGEDHRPRVSATTLSRRFNFNLDAKLQHVRNSFCGPILRRESGEILITLADACGILWKYRNHPQTLSQQFCEELESLYTSTSTTLDLRVTLPHTLQTAGGLESIAQVFSTQPTERTALVTLLQHQNHTAPALAPISQLKKRQASSRINSFESFAMDFFGGSSSKKLEEMVVGFRLFLESRPGLYEQLLTQSGVLVRRAKRNVLDELHSAVTTEIAYANAAAKIVLRLSSQDLAWLRKVFKQVAHVIGFNVVLNYKYVLHSYERSTNHCPLL